MKKYVWLLIVAALLFIGYIAVTPYLTVTSIKTAVIEKDSEKLAGHIDFPVFRGNLKKQFSTAMSNNVPTGIKNSPFGGIAAGFASNMVDNLVDSYVTPDSLAKLMKGIRPSRSRTRIDQRPEAGRKERDEIFKDAKYTYDSVDQFSVWMPTDTGDEIRFVFKRYGLGSWKLVDLVVQI
jgi:hypothetical protein